VNKAAAMPIFAMSRDVIGSTYFRFIFWVLQAGTQFLGSVSKPA